MSSTKASLVGKTNVNITVIKWYFIHLLGHFYPGISNILAVISHMTTTSAIQSKILDVAWIRLDTRDTPYQNKSHHPKPTHLRLFCIAPISTTISIHFVWLFLNV